MAGIHADDPRFSVDKAAKFLEGVGVSGFGADISALGAHDYARSARLAEENVSELLRSGRLASLRTATAALPAEAVEGRPWPCILQASSAFFEGSPGDVEPWVLRAEGHMPEDEIQRRRVISAGSTIRAFVADNNR
jgi:ATP/maltotriose-dependent transcriptional regulator MalT